MQPCEESAVLPQRNTAWIYRRRLAAQARSRCSTPALRARLGTDGPGARCAALATRLDDRPRRRPTTSPDEARRQQRLVKGLNRV